MTDESASFEQRFASLDAASRTLSGDVAALNDTLQVVTALQKEQAEQKLRQAAVENQVTETIKRTKARDRRNRNAIFGVAIGLAVLLPIVSILVYASLITHVNLLLTQQDVQRYQNCLGRNAATMENSDRERKLGDIETNAALKEIHLDSSRTLKATVRACVQPKDR